MTADAIASLVRDADVYLAGWNSVLLPEQLARDPGRLKYICGITGAMREYVPLELVEAGIPLTNWGDAPANDVAEGAVLLLLAMVKSLNNHIQWVRGGGKFTGLAAGGTLFQMNVGVYGCGVIGQRFVDLLRGFGPMIRVFDPYLVDPPTGCEMVESLAELFAKSEAVVIHAGLTPQTKRSVTAELLAMLPDNGIIVNTARGEIIEQPALFRELESGRLRAGLDVLDGDWLDQSSPLRTIENVIFTGHAIARSSPPNAASAKPSRMEMYCVENLKRFGSGEPLHSVIDVVRFQQST